VMLRRRFGVAAEAISMPPDLESMLAAADAALVIGDVALFLEATPAIQKIDLGELWTATTGLPFVYAFWAGWPEVLTPADGDALLQARDRGVAGAAEVARTYYPDDLPRQAVAERYLRDNIRYTFGDEELEGLRTFYAYTAELGLASFDGALRFYHAEHYGAR
jgi:chorismate dehydratase